MSDRYVVREEPIQASECIGYVIEDSQTGEEMARGTFRHECEKYARELNRNPPKVPGTVEDRHAALASEIRMWAVEGDEEYGPPSDVTGQRKLIEWAARVEQLGAQRTAREAEIAKVREEWIAIADAAESLGDGTHTFNVHAMRAYAARLGGAS